VRDIVAAGHEIGHHGYLLANPVALETRQREREALLKRFDVLDRAAGVRPVGYRSPSWDNSPWTIELLLKVGFRFGSSLMGNNYTSYWCRVGDVIQPDGPYLFGAEVDLVEMLARGITDLGFPPVGDSGWRFQADDAPAGDRPRASHAHAGAAHRLDAGASGHELQQAGGRSRDISRSKPATSVSEISISRSHD
jgi:peptidoglycan/xylan/chitin deacetylase (PgdA/CDA1 family)